MQRLFRKILAQTFQVLWSPYITNFYFAKLKNVTFLSKLSIFTNFKCPQQGIIFLIMSTYLSIPSSMSDKILNLDLLPKMLSTNVTGQDSWQSNIPVEIWSCFFKMNHKSTWLGVTWLSIIRLIQNCISRIYSKDKLMSGFLCILDPYK